MKSEITQMREWLDNRDAHSGKIRKAELRYIRTKCHELETQYRAKNESANVLKIIKELASAIEWCSASEDFGIDGKARYGWERICIHALDKANNFLMGKGVK